MRKGELPSGSLFVIVLMSIALVALSACTPTPPSAPLLPGGPAADTKETPQDSGAARTSDDATASQEALTRQDRMTPQDSLADPSAMPFVPQGTLIAGATSPYVEFNQADYDRAQAAGKTIYLEFFANWCPTCNADAAEIESFFVGRSDAGLVGFRVNYKDGATSPEEVELARMFGITYQHTRVILKDGEVAYKETGAFDEPNVVAALA